MSEKAIDFEQLFNAVQGLYLILSPNLTIVAVNDAYNKATMTKREDILGKALFEVFPDNPDDLSADGVSNLQRSLNNVLKNKKAHSMAVQKYDIRRPDGTFEERHWSPINSPLFDENGEISYIIHRVEDVTEFVFMQNDHIQTKKITKNLQSKIQEMESQILTRSKEVQLINSELEQKIQQLIDSENKFQKAFQASAAGMTITKLSDSTYLDVNNTFTKMVGLSREEIIGKTSKDLGLIMNFERREEIMKELKEKGSIKNIEMTICNRFAQVIEILASIETTEIEGEKYAINIIYDITQRKRAEEQLAVVNKDLEAFSYSISHDLRAPLKTINNYADKLIQDYENKIDKDGTRIFGNIKYYTEKMGTLIDELLAFSHAGKKELQTKTIDLNELLEGVLNDIDKAIKHDAKINSEKLPTIQADYGLMYQALFNLVSNAIKYSSKNKNAKIDITYEEKEDEFVFSIQDNGSGFNMEHVDKLFNVFERLHSDDEFEGTGVGLAIVKRIINKHGGQVWAKGKVDEGATFYFTVKK